MRIHLVIERECAFRIKLNMLGYHNYTYPLQTLINVTTGNWLLLGGIVLAGQNKPRGRDGGQGTGGA